VGSARSTHRLRAWAVELSHVRKKVVLVNAGRAAANLSFLI